MSDALLMARGSGVFELSGVLSFDTVAALRQEGARLFADFHSLQIDLAQVVRSDSAGLALLIEWMRFARRGNREIRFQNIPPQMLAIARVSSLDDVLPLTRN